MTDEHLVTSGEMADKLLYEAAIAARKMPKLQKMELWDLARSGWHDEEASSIFRYEVDQLQRDAVITWRSSWDFQMS